MKQEKTYPVRKVERVCHGLWVRIIFPLGRGWEDSLSRVVASSEIRSVCWCLERILGRVLVRRRPGKSPIRKFQKISIIYCYGRLRFCTGRERRGFQSVSKWNCSNVDLLGARSRRAKCPLELVAVFSISYLSMVWIVYWCWKKKNKTLTSDAI